MPLLVRTAEELRVWKKRRRANNAELAQLTGRSLSTVDRKRNGRTEISPMLTLTLALANIDVSRRRARTGELSRAAGAPDRKADCAERHEIEKRPCSKATAVASTRLKGRESVKRASPRTEVPPQRGHRASRSCIWPRPPGRAARPFRLAGFPRRAVPAGAYSPGCARAVVGSSGSPWAPSRRVLQSQTGNGRGLGSRASSLKARTTGRTARRCPGRRRRRPWRSGPRARSYRARGDRGSPPAAAPSPPTTRSPGHPPSANGSTSTQASKKAR